VSAQLGRIRWYKGQVETGIGELEASYAVLARDEPDADLGALAAELARSHFFGGHIDEALRWIDPKELLFLQHLASDHYVLGDWDESIAALDEMVELAPVSHATELSDKWWPKPILQVNRGVAVALPDADEEENADRQSRAGSAVGWAAVLFAQGSFAEALASAGSAWNARDVLGMHVFTKFGFELAAEAAFALGDTERVERLLADLGALPPGQTVPSLRTHAARFEARLAALRGDNERVEPSFTAAAEGFRELAMPFPEAVAQLEHAEWLSAQGRADEADELVARARSTFERLQAQPWVERAARLGPQRLEVAAQG
jgi:tetratricopeptide (TPR) repeat protein